MAEFETDQIPDGITKYLRSKTERSYANSRKPNQYWVSDICGCLRQSYYELSGTPIDEVQTNESIESLWSLQSRNFLHNLTYSYNWRELDVDAKIPIELIDEQLIITGRLDMYDYKSQTIIDLKTTNAVKWQHEKGLIPRISDVQQVQCYASLANNIVRVSNLILLYADMKNMIPFKVPIIDNQKWIKERVAQLHISRNITKLPPDAEPSELCDFCKFKRRCELQGPT